MAENDDRFFCGESDIVDDVYVSDENCIKFDKYFRCIDKPQFLEIGSHEVMAGQISRMFWPATVYATVSVNHG